MMLSYGQRIPIKSRSEIEKMRIAGRHVAESLLELREQPRLVDDLTVGDRKIEQG